MEDLPGFLAVFVEQIRDKVCKSFGSTDEPTWKFDPQTTVPDWPHSGCGSDMAASPTEVCGEFLPPTTPLRQSSSRDRTVVISGKPTNTETAKASTPRAGVWRSQRSTASLAETTSNCDWSSVIRRLAQRRKSLSQSAVVSQSTARRDVSHCRFLLQRKTSGRRSVFAPSAAVVATTCKLRASVHPMPRWSGSPISMFIAHGTRGGQGCGRPATQQHDQVHVVSGGTRVASLERNDWQQWVSKWQKLGPSLMD